MRNTGHPEGSYYRATAAPLPRLLPLAGQVHADVCVVGAGYTGLGAALELAARGASVVVLEDAVIGSGGSGRNGGQVHAGFRRDQTWVEARVGKADALALWRLAQDAMADLKGLIAEYAIACDLKPGLIHARHRPRGERADARRIELMASRYGYDQLELIDREALAEDLGTGVYYGGTIDHGGGHLHPLRLAIGLALAAMNRGARICERSRVVGWRREGGQIKVATRDGRVLCDQLILTGDGYLDGLSPKIEARVIPINSFIAATAPLGKLGSKILRSGRAAADSRFVVNYFRKSADGRLLFGGGETYGQDFPKDPGALVRRHLLKVYPQLESVRITHAWGGTLGVTTTRAPYVGQVAPGVWTAAGYSGQGVALAPYCGKLLARATFGETDGVDLLARLPTPPFPGGKLLRAPLAVAALSWGALRDRLG